MTDYKALILNLDRSPDRLRAMDNNFSEFRENMIRIPGVYGRYLPLIAASKLAGQPIEKKLLGRLGCMLSHVSAWEYIVQNSIENALILEDDTYPIREIPQNFASIGLPTEYDICFVNERMAFGLDHLGPEQYVSTRDAVQNFPEDHNAPGGDGYLLSNNGARRLLEIFSQDGFGGFLDWRLLAYSLDSIDIADLARNHTARVVVQIIHSSYRTRSKIKSFVLKQPFIKTDSSDTIINEMEYEI